MVDWSTSRDTHFMSLKPTIQLDTKKGEITPFYINRQKEITTKYAIFVNENTYLSGIC